MAAKPLQPYRSKRDFSKTSEPAGSDAAGAGNRFVVHRHSATAEHYDLRLELDGVLKSWAVPKGPSLNPNDKRLAVETEDHPVEYIDYEGVIPDGEYGGGPMIVWDTGTWAPMEEPKEALAKGAFKFRLSGEKLKGGWMLARLKPKPDDAKKNWILFKERDPAANTGIDILKQRPESVKSGRMIEELVEAPPAAANPAKTKQVKVGSVAGAVKAALPERVEPQLATRAVEPPSGKDWMHELKFDGYRTMARIADGDVALITRSGLDWTKRYGFLRDALRGLNCKQAMIDGEIVVVDDNGVARFAALQQALSSGDSHRLTFYAFDLIYLDGWDLRKATLAKRKQLLAQLLAGQASGSSPVQFSDHVEGDGRALFERVAELGLEGIVSKRSTAPYVSGRTATWTKSKALVAGDFVIAGYSTSKAAEGLAALAVAEWEGDELQYRGKVGTGFSAATAASLLKRLEGMREGAQPLDGARKEIMPVLPVLTARVHYSNRTDDNLLRHAVFKNLREVELTSTAQAPRKRLISDADLAQIWVTNPTRRLFGKSGPTKLDIAVYYAAVGDTMLPHILGRPVSLFRCPTGKLSDCFYQRHAFTGMPATIAKTTIKNSEGEEKTYISVEDVKGYLALAQFGVVEFHAWGALRTDIEKPDRIIFDLDPGEGIGWREVVEAATHVRGQLEEIGLVPFAKTSGGRGIHVVVPVKPKLGWKDIHRATAEIAAAIAKAAPDTFTTVMGKENRKRLIFIDFHRNARGATAAAAYSLRAKPHMPVSTPLSWDDLESIDGPEDLNYSSLPGLLATSGDPWDDINDFARELPAAVVGRK